jgi:hypothetical protein
VLAPATFAVGLVSLGVGATLFILGRRASPADARPAAFRVDVAPMPGRGATASLLAAF